MEVVELEHMLKVVEARGLRRGPRQRSQGFVAGLIGVLTHGSVWEPLYSATLGEDGKPVVKLDPQCDARLVDESRVVVEL